MQNPATQESPSTLDLDLFNLALPSVALAPDSDDSDNGLSDASDLDSEDSDSDSSVAYNPQQYLMSLPNRAKRPLPRRVICSASEVSDAGTISATSYHSSDSLPFIKSILRHVTPTLKRKECSFTPPSSPELPTTRKLLASVSKGINTIKKRLKQSTLGFTIMTPEEKKIRVAKDREERLRDEEESSDVERGKSFRVAESVLGKRKLETTRKSVYRAKIREDEIRSGKRDEDGKLPKRIKLTVR